MLKSGFIGNAAITITLISFFAGGSLSAHAINDTEEIPVSYKSFEEEKIGEREIGYGKYFRWITSELHFSIKGRINKGSSSSYMLDTWLIDSCVESIIKNLESKEAQAGFDNWIESTNPDQIKELIFDLVRYYNEIDPFCEDALNLAEAIIIHLQRQGEKVKGLRGNYISLRLIKK